MSTATERASGATPPATATAAARMAALDTPEKARRGLSLATRLFLSAAALLVVTIGSAIAFASWRASRIAEEKIRADLQAVPSIWEGYRDSQAGAKRAQMRSLAEEPGTKALLAEMGATPETFRDTGADFAESLGASTVFFFDAQGLLIARSDRAAGDEAGRDFSGVTWVRDPLAHLTEAAAHILELRTGRVLSLVASAPVVQGMGEEIRVNGVIAASFAIDGARAQEIARITDGEAAFIGNVAPRDERPALQNLASTRRLAGPAVVAAVSSTPGAVDALFVKGQPVGPIELDLQGDRYLGTLMPIQSGGGEPIAALLVARSKQAELAAFQRIRESLLAMGGIILLVSIPISFALARGPGAAHPRSWRTPRTRSGAGSSTRRCRRRAAARWAPWPARSPPWSAS